MDPGNTSYPLVTSGLKNPLGLAVDLENMVLFVCEPDDKKIYMYKLIHSHGEIHTDGVQYVAASPTESRSVAVDTHGDIRVESDLPIYGTG